MKYIGKCDFSRMHSVDYMCRIFYNIYIIKTSFIIIHTL